MRTLPPPVNHSDHQWVRLRTLIVLRWLAIGGQLAAIFAAVQLYGLQLDLGLCLMVVGLSVITNLIAMFIYPASKRLSEPETMLTLLFDISQLVLLLFLSGGVQNPFALLILAPVTISATALPLRSTVFLGASAIAFMTLVALVHRPLVTDAGEVLRMPGVFVFGYWLAIVIGILFLGLYAHRVANEMRSMANALLATQITLAREQKLTDLGGVVAATAHELGTPLATITLVSSELIDELAGFPELRDDAALIRQQADRCRDILRSMGRMGKDDLLLRHAPLSAVIREAAEPHMGRGKVIHLECLPPETGDAVQPVIQRQPEIIHGLRNLVQNAVDFARSAVWIDAEWTDDMIIVRIIDDGEGFSPQVIGRIGDPFMRNRKPDPVPPAAGGVPGRPGYEGMGLGLFIAKTLLERSGAELSFDNGAAAQGERSGAIVEVIWPLDRIEQGSAAPLGQNMLFAT